MQDAPESINRKSQWDGSTYSGPISKKWYEGTGSLKFSSGITYVGGFHKGHFHGHGTLHFPNGGKFVARFDKGSVIDGTESYKFFDGLLYQSNMWNFITEEDRRFHKENFEVSTKTAAAVSPTAPSFPIGSYICSGKGYYDPSTGLIYNQKTRSIMKVPHKLEAEWIEKYCKQPSRHGLDEAA